MYHLVVVNAWGDYRRGDVIAADAAMAETMVSEHRADVVKVTAPHPHVTAIQLADAEWAALTTPAA